MLLPICLSLMMLSQPSGGRDALLKQATAHWRLNNAVPSGAHPLRTQGQIERDIPLEGTGANADGKAVRLTNAYFDAGTTLPVNHAALTVYLRARDPRGQWTYGLFNKRGSLDTSSFNLFSADLPPTPGPDIGFELHTGAGLVAAHFPVSRIAPTAWHDFVGMYDGLYVSLYCDGKLMSRRAWYGKTTHNDVPILIGAETDHGQVVRPFTGEMEEAALWPRALNDNELSSLMRKEKIVPDAAYVAPVPPPPSPVHYRPQFARLADTIPFFWRGEYHIFYLRSVEHVPWEHIVSRDLIHWKELPTALVADGAPDGPDGFHMFTGSVIEHDGTFHIYYTGWNPNNPQGQEFMMHATSPDLIHWTKAAAGYSRAGWNTLFQRPLPGFPRPVSVPQSRHQRLYDVLLFGNAYGRGFFARPGSLDAAAAHRFGLHRIGNARMSRHVSNRNNALPHHVADQNQQHHCPPCRKSARPLQ